MSTTHLSKAEAGAGSFFFSSLGPLRLSRLSRLLLLLSPIINLVTSPHSSSHIISRLSFPYLLSLSLNSPPYSLLEASQLLHIHLNKMQLTASKKLSLFYIPHTVVVESLYSLWSMWSILSMWLAAMDLELRCTCCSARGPGGTGISWSGSRQVGARVPKSPIHPLLPPSWRRKLPPTGS